MRNLEQELKLQLDAREYGILMGQTDTEPVKQVNYYFAPVKPNKNIMIRLRKKGEQFLICYKVRLSHTNGVMVSDEKEMEVSADYADSLITRGITAKELKDFFGVDLYEDFYCVGSLATYRAKFTLQEWCIELDKNEYFGITDYELECENRQVQSLEKLKSYLTYTFGIVIRNSQTKFERFLSQLNKK